MKHARRERRLSHALERLERVRRADAKAALTVMREITELVLGGILEDRLNKTISPGMCIAALDQQLCELGALPRRVRVHVRHLQDLGNLGAHVQSEDDEPNDDDVAAAGKALDVLLRWHSEHQLPHSSTPAESECTPATTRCVSTAAHHQGESKMQRSSYRGGRVPMDHLSPDQLLRAKKAAASFRDSGPKDADTRGERIVADLDRGSLSEDNLISLARWCHSRGRNIRGVEPAQELSRALFDGRVLPWPFDDDRKLLPGHRLQKLLGAFLAGSPE
jgi:hypothetical protein